MFIYSVRASTIRFFSIIGLTIAVMIGILVFNGSADSITTASASVNLSEVKTNEDRVAFIARFGIIVQPVPKESEEIRIPESFDKLLSEYNEIQKRQGLDLSKYKNKKVTRYAYETENYNGGSAYVNLVIYKGTVIACDVSSSAESGFVDSLIKF